MGFPGGLAEQNPPARDAGQIPGWQDPLEKECQPMAAFLPGESHGQRSLAG